MSLVLPHASVAAVSQFEAVAAPPERPRRGPPAGHHQNQSVFVCVHLWLSL